MSSSWDMGSRAEQRLNQQLREQGYLVFATCEATRNSHETKAPMITLPKGLLVAPDFLVMPLGGNGSRFWIDSKAKSIPSWRRTSSRWEHGIDYASLAEYEKVERLTGIRVYIGIFEERTPESPYRDSPLISSDQWLFISIEKAQDVGTHRPDWPGGKAQPQRRGKNGQGGWLWARTEMSPTLVIPGAAPQERLL